MMATHSATEHAVSARRVRVQIHYDQDAMSPRESDTFGTLVIVDAYGVDIEGQRSGAASAHEAMRGESVAVRVDLPSSLYDRSARDGFIYASRADVIAEYGACNATTKDEARKLLESEAREYRAWADGSVFGYVVETFSTCAECGAESQDEIESCWGFITRNPERDLLEWLSPEMPNDAAREALALALGDGWTGDYPMAGEGSAAL